VQRSGRKYVAFEKPEESRGEGNPKNETGRAAERAAIEELGAREYLTEPGEEVAVRRKRGAP